MLRSDVSKTEIGNLTTYVAINGRLSNSEKWNPCVTFSIYWWHFDSLSYIDKFTSTVLLKITILKKSDEN